MKTTSPRHILVLTSDTGFGHRCTATVVAVAQESRYGEAVHGSVVNALDHKPVPAVIRSERVGYDTSQLFSAEAIGETRHVLSRSRSPSPSEITLL